MTLEEIVTKITQKTLAPTGFHARVLFDFSDEGCVFVDTTQSPAEIGTTIQEADVTLTTSLENFGKILEGQLDPNFAFLMGKLKISGSMGTAMKLNAFLEG